MLVWLDRSTKNVRSFGADGADRSRVRPDNVLSVGWPQTYAAELSHGRSQKDVLARKHSACIFPDSMVPSGVKLMNNLLAVCQQIDMRIDMTLVVNTCRSLFMISNVTLILFLSPVHVQAEVAAVVMTGGLAHVCLVTSHMTITRARIEMNIPRKRAGNSDHRKAMARFYEAVYQVSCRSEMRMHLAWID